MVYLAPGPLLSGTSNYPKTKLDASSTTENACMIKIGAAIGGISIQTYAVSAAVYSIYITNTNYSDAKADVETADEDVIWTLQDTFSHSAGAGMFRQYSGVCGAIKVVCTTGIVKVAVCAK
jgi:hypothetical protein